ncbi:MAG: DUF1858 domain-containing protein [Candidatus Stahlbacteria bacterium]|nr:MAG: DUF1858 domain-containing protein [Candidatus Stahlbacteria bacterium]
MDKKINGDVTIEDVVRLHPDSIDVFMKFGIKPIVCGDPMWGTINEEAKKANVDINILLKELNKILGK